MEIPERLQKVAAQRALLLQGDAKRVDRQHADGKNTARERIAKLFDNGSFVEIDALRTDANAVAGSGTVDGFPAYCFAQDFTMSSGAVTRAQNEKLLKVLRQAEVTGSPVILMLDSAGLKITEGAAAMALYSETMAAFARLSGICPLITAVMGPCAGMATAFTALSDINIQVKKTASCAMFTSAVMTDGKGADKTADTLFGADTMAAQGEAGVVCENEDEALVLCRRLVSLLPSSDMADAPVTEADDLNRLVDADNVTGLINEIADHGQTVVLGAAYGPAAQTVLCRVGGYTCGILTASGRLDAAACKKAARFVRFCDCFRLPLVTLTDTEGLDVPAFAAQGDAIRAAAQLCYAAAESAMPKIAVICGSAIGSAYTALGGRGAADIIYAWPNACIAPLTADTAVAAFDGAKLNAGEDREELKAAYEEKCGALYAAQNGMVDDIIDPAETRKYILNALEMLYNKNAVNLPRKHGNMPL